MPFYRRFVAYVYEYRKGKKEENCGFIRVEAREEQCRIELHVRCPGLPADSGCEIKGIVRGEDMARGVRIGTCKTIQDGMECMLTCQTNNLDLAGTGLRDLGGLILLTESGAFLGTEWDDIPIVPEEFLQPRQGAMSKKGMPEAETPNEKIPQTEISNERPLNEKIPQAEISKEKPLKEVIPNEVIPNEKIPKEKIPKEEMPKEEMPEEKLSVQEILTEIAEPQVNLQKEIIWPGEPYDPFGDGEIHSCRKIHPKDLRLFGQREGSLRNNRFVMHAYSSFGHLLVGKMASGEYIMGVPGGYDQQERFMAGMYGFPYFKESPEIQLKEGKGGYWYRLIDTSDFHFGNRS